MHRSARLLAPLALVLLGSCALHSTAKSWHGRVGPNGKPVYVMTTTHVGMNLFVFIPVVGNTNVPTMINEVTQAIAQDDGDNIRIVQTGTENYWYGWPPLTWIITPVVSSTIAEYEPSDAMLGSEHAVWAGTADPDAAEESGQ